MGGGCQTAFPSLSAQCIWVTVDPVTKPAPSYVIPPEGEAAFSACQAQQPDDFCVKYYLDQCRAILSTPLPLPKGWDGQIMMESK